MLSEELMPLPPAVGMGLLYLLTGLFLILLVIVILIGAACYFEDDDDERKE